MLLQLIIIFIIYYIIQKLRKRYWFIRTMNCYREEGIVILCREYECNKHQRVNSEHLLLCNEQRWKILGIHKYNNNKYIAFTCDKSSKINLVGDYWIKGEYKKILSKPGCDEKIIIT